MAKTSVTYPSGAIVTTFDPPPAGFDPLEADPETLREHGYPPRPSDAAELARWAELIGKPLRTARPVLTELHRSRPLRIFEGEKQAENWSGAEVKAVPNNGFFAATGRWKVPHFKASDDERHASIWVGIDGDGSSDLLQGGVEASRVDGDLDLFAWVEWFPHVSVRIDNLPVAQGDTLTCFIATDEDCLPGFTVQLGRYETIDGTHELIAMHDGNVLDWRPDGTWRLFRYDPTSPDGLAHDLLSSGQWKTIRKGHRLIPMHDGKVLDWVPADGTWRLWNYDPATKENCLSSEHSHGQWNTVRLGHELVPMKDGNVLDWVSADGTWHLWKYDSQNRNDCLPTEVSRGQWAGVGDGDVLIPMKDGNVLDFFPGDRTWRLWKYDPTNHADCLPAPAISAGEWLSIGSGHALVPMHDGRVLDWQSDGHWRLWNYRPHGHSNAQAGIVLRNETQNVERHLHIQAPKDAFLVGNCAEWIVERPSPDGKALYVLLDYGSVEFTHAHAKTLDNVLVEASAGDTIDMVEGGKIVSRGSASGETVTCKFV